MFYFICSYFYNKALLLRYYERTNEFDQDLPLLSMKLIRFSFVLHYLTQFFTIVESKLFENDHKQHGNFFFHTDYVNATKDDQVSYFKFIFWFITVFILFSLELFD